MDPREALLAHIGDKKVLNVTAPMLAYCPHSLMIYELKARARGVELIMRKTELWMSTHGRYPEAAEVTNLSTTIVSLLQCSLLRSDPVELLGLLRPVLSRYTALTVIRGQYGAAGLRAYSAKTVADAEHPVDIAEAITAAAGAAASAKRYKPDAGAGAVGASGAGHGGGGGTWRAGRGGRRGGHGGGTRAGNAQQQQAQGHTPQGNGAGAQAGPGNSAPETS
jgi:hypothetical protein